MMKLIEGLYFDIHVDMHLEALLDIDTEIQMKILHWCQNKLDFKTFPWLYKILIPMILDITIGATKRCSCTR